MAFRKKKTSDIEEDEVEGGADGRFEQLFENSMSDDGAGSDWNNEEPVVVVRSSSRRKQRSIAIESIDPLDAGGDDNHLSEFITPSKPLFFIKYKI